MPPRALKRGAAADVKKRTARKVQNQQQPKKAEEVLILEEKSTVVDEKPVVMEEKSVVAEDKLVTEEKKGGEDEIGTDLEANGSASLKSKFFSSNYRVRFGSFGIYSSSGAAVCVLFAEICEISCFFQNLI